MNDAAGPGEQAAVEALSGAQFFDGVPAEVLASLAAHAEIIEIEAGETLFKQGEESSDLYIVRSGAVAVTAEQPDGSILRVGEAFSGETVGEMAMLTAEPRTATVTATRDSELLRLSRGAIGAAVARDPAIGLSIARVLARRLARAQDARRPVARPRVFALLPHEHFDRARAADFIGRLIEAARAFGPTASIDRRDAHRSRSFFQQSEAKHDASFLIGDPSDPGWSIFCARQADLLLLLADGDKAAAPSAHWAAARAARPKQDTQRELILIGDPAREPSGSGAWKDAAGPDFIHHVRDGGDISRIARLIARRATTIVLSGGGARGFAHLGVIDALTEAGIGVDIWGGASMGAIVAAAHAGGWPRDMARAKLRAAFVEDRPLSDPVFPVVALFRGRKVAWLLERAFGDRFIEDLQRPYFCVSSNLTLALPSVHRAGLLRRWLQASVAIPGALPPVVEGGSVHVDGGIIDNLPIAAAQALARGAIIGVDVSGDEHFEQNGAPASIPSWQRWFGGRDAGVPTIMETLWRVGTIGSVSTSHRDQENALVIRPPVGTIGLLDWKSFDRAIDIGYQHTKTLIAERPELFTGLRRAP